MSRPVAEPPAHRHARARVMVAPSIVWEILKEAGIDPAPPTARP